jgi:high-affinity Fe2+/Pb2+ permease
VTILTWREVARARLAGNPYDMIGVILAVLLAALVYWLCTALGLPAIVGIVAAILVLLAGVGTGGYGLRSRGRAI